MRATMTDDSGERPRPETEPPRGLGCSWGFDGNAITDAVGAGTAAELVRDRSRDLSAGPDLDYE